jgi:hypothetical protein
MVDTKDEPTPFRRISGDRPPGPRPAQPPPPKPTAGRATTKAVVELIPFPKLQEMLTEYYTMGAMALMMKYPATSIAMRDNAEKCASVWVDYAKSSPKAHKMISRMLSGVGLLTVVAAHAPIFMALYKEQQIAPDLRMSAFMMQHDTTESNNTNVA